MILSFHPCFEADKNILYAGRSPNESDLIAIKRAEAVILPQGCDEKLYKIARLNCKNIFPNFDARFSYPGKTGQIKLFRLARVPHPKSWEYSSVKYFLDFVYFKQKMPFIFKYDWGGEGSGVFLVEKEKMFKELLYQAKLFERSGHCGFLIQEYVNSPNRTLRVVVIGEKIVMYWKIQKEPSFFGEHLSSGAYIEQDVNLQHMKPSIDIVSQFCSKMKINLAGFDLIFDKKGDSPLMLEINYFFGRRGLGGIKQYYKMLCGEINNWITSIRSSAVAF